jgi:hypothetical protein
MESLMGVVKPVGQAMSAATAAKGLLAPTHPALQPSPIMQPAQQNNNLNQIVSGYEQQSQFQKQLMDQEKARRMELLARMGGR